MNRISKEAAKQIKAMPIFSQIMRDANRAGRKSQTRRLVDLPQWSTQDWNDYEPGDPGSSVFYSVQAYEPPLIIAHNTGCLAEIKSPYGYPGEIRYMREPLFKGSDDYACYLDDFTSGDLLTPVYHAITGERLKWNWQIETLSGMYMPKYAARTFMKLDSLRVQNLWMISESDCIAEGVVKNGDNAYFISGDRRPDKPGYFQPSAGQAYRRLWESIHGAGGWEPNPLVWAIGYSMLADHGEIITL